MLFYLASAYARRAELNVYAAELRAMGHRVDARWLGGENAMHDGDLETHGTDLIPVRWAAESAAHDMEDLARADEVIVFSSRPGTPMRGGLHVELGMALALKKPVHLVGHRMHIFHHLPGVHYRRTWWGPTGMRAYLIQSTGGD